MATTDISRSLVRLRLRGFFCGCRERLHGAMATRRIPDPKIGGSIPSEVIPLFVFPEITRHRVRVVKELVLKANGLCPREFKSRRCRHFCFVFVTKVL